MRPCAVQRASAESLLTMASNTVKPSVTLSGHAFCRQHHFVLSAFARARGYTSPVWVPLPMAKLLGLPLRHDAHNPVRLVACNGHCFYYHVSQFALSETAMRRRWEVHVAANERRSTSNLNNSMLLAAGQQQPLQHPQLPFPRNVNGERFARDVEAAILARFDTTQLSPYWATVDEAAYLFDAPFRDDFVRPDNAVAVRHELCLWPVLYYNVSGSRRPERFTPQTCRRYDPYNFRGKFYTPNTALRLKYAALRYGCLEQPRWVTPRRVRASGGHLLPHAQPVRLHVRLATLTLVNVAMTSCAADLFDHSGHVSTASATASPTTVHDDIAEEEERERFFVIPDHVGDTFLPDS